MHGTIRVLLTIGVTCLLAGCPRPSLTPTSGEQAPRPVLPADLRGAVLYDVNPRDSRVDVLVYRAGPLARLGHNHVMTVRQLAGRAWLNPDMAKSGFNLSFPVAALMVDDPAARRAAGDEFPPEIPMTDREGTRSNMLRPEVLDGGRYPEVRLQAVQGGTVSPVARLMVRVTLKGVSRDVPVTASIGVAGTSLTAAGEFDILQSDFGIQPFSVGLGALQVRDRLRVRFKVSADQVRTHSSGLP